MKALDRQLSVNGVLCGFLKQASFWSSQILADVTENEPTLYLLTERRRESSDEASRVSIATQSFEIATCRQKKRKMIR
jgi:hypothetical protein